MIPLHATICNLESNIFLTIDFLKFGEGVGDSIGTLGDDLNTGPIDLSVPIVYFSEQQTLLYVSADPCIMIMQSVFL